MNLRQEYATAALRGLVLGALVGAAGFFAAWAQSDDVKQLVSAGAVPAITTWLGLLGYGVKDARRNDAGA